MGFDGVLILGGDRVGFDRVLIGVHGDLVRVIFFLTLSFLIFDFVSLSLSLSLSLVSHSFSLCAGG